MAQTFVELGIVLLTAGAFAYLAHLGRQPLLLAYLLAGLILGPAVLGVVSDTAFIGTMSEVGIAFLLFMVGLEMDVRKMKNIGKPVIIAGLAQVIFTFIIGYFLSRYLGLEQIQSFYVSFGLTLSSTVLVIKLLSDRGELNTLHAHLAVGILLVQDVLAMIVLALLPNVKDISFSPVFGTLIAGMVLLGFSMVAGRLVLEPVFRRFARSEEMLFIASLSWLFLLGMLAYALKFSVSIGAFIAGVSLASLSYRHAIISGTRSLRNFFATIFFVTLGMQVTLAGLTAYWQTILFLTFFVVIGNPIIVFLVLVLFGFTSRTSLLTGISLAQVSEFSLIIALEGARLGHIPPEIISLIALVLLLSFAISTYLIVNGHLIYSYLSPFLKFFERYAFRERHLGYIPKNKFVPDAVVYGCGRMGFSVLKALRSMDYNPIVVDGNPDIIRRLQHEKIPCVYGSVSDTEIASEIKLPNMKIIVSTIPDFGENKSILGMVGRRKKPIVILIASQSDEALELYDLGADYVVLPHHLGGHHVAMFLHESSNNIGKLLKHRNAHLRELTRKPGMRFR